MEGLCLLLFHIDDHATHVITAVGASHMLRHRRAALGTIAEVLGRFGVVGAPATGAGIGGTPFGNCHDRISLSNKPTWQKPTGPTSEAGQIFGNKETNHPKSQEKDCQG